MQQIHSTFRDLQILNSLFDRARDCFPKRKLDECGETEADCCHWRTGSRRVRRSALALSLSRGAISAGCHLRDWLVGTSTSSPVNLRL